MPDPLALAWGDQDLESSCPYCGFDCYYALNEEEHGEIGSAVRCAQCARTYVITVQCFKPIRKKARA